MRSKNILLVSVSAFLFVLISIGMSIDAAGQNYYDLSISQGWNLLSLPCHPLDNSADFIFKSVVDDIKSIWKWNNDNWCVLLFNQDTAQYALSKGFTVLYTLNYGEGFWVNASANTAISI